VSENIEVNKESDPVFHPFFDRKQKLTVAIALKKSFLECAPKGSKKQRE
jgi:hypothetical protein